MLGLYTTGTPIPLLAQLDPFELGRRSRAHPQVSIVSAIKNSVERHGVDHFRIEPRHNASDKRLRSVQQRCVRKRSSIQVLRDELRKQCSVVGSQQTQITAADQL